MKWFVAALLFNLICVVGGILTNSIILWDTKELGTILLLTLAVFSLTPKRNIKFKITTLLFVMYSMSTLLDYILISAFEEYDVYIRYFSMFVFLSFILPMMVSTLFKDYNPYPSIYDPTKCYLAYKRPRSLQGYITALFNLPYGSVSLVVKGHRFCFKGYKFLVSNGGIVERAHKGNYVYREIKDVKLKEARKLIGTPWKPFNNCFTVFNKFKE